MVIIAARWVSYATAKRFDNGEGGIEHGRVNPFTVAGADPGDRTFTKAIIDRFVQGIRQYLDAGYRVVLVHPVPEAGWNVPDMAFKFAHFDGLALADMQLSTSTRVFSERIAAVETAFNVLQHTNLAHVRPGDVLCDSIYPDRCANIVDGRILYYDDDHLSTAGAALISPRIVEAVHAVQNPE